MASSDIKIYFILIFAYTGYLSISSATRHVHTVYCIVHGAWKFERYYDTKFTNSVSGTQCNNTYGVEWWCFYFLNLGTNI